MADFSAKFYANFIKDDRWLGLVTGLKVTIIVTLEALLLGVLIGFLIAIIRSYHDKTGKFKILDILCRVYLTVIRGTPTMIQILIMYLVVFGASSLDSIIIGGLSTLPYLQAVRPVTDHGPGHSHRRGLRSFLFYGALQLCKLPYILPPHRRDQLHGLSR